MTDDPSFDIPARPRRRYPASGGVEYEGETVFRLEPDDDHDTADLDDALGRVLEEDRYVRGDFFDLPAPAYLVHDERVGTSFRVVVRDGHVELHVLPHTEAGALAALYERLVAETDGDWDVDCRSDPAPGDG